MTEQKRERSHYAPYDTYPEFDRGMKDWGNGVTSNPYDANSVEAQAWDRGAEYASYLFRWKQRHGEDT